MPGDIGVDQTYAKIVAVNDSSTVQRLVGVYNADGTVLGELSYFLRSRIGRAHCALCDVTHGRIRERADWKAVRGRLPVSFTTYHRNDQPNAIRLASAGRTPVVLAELEGGHMVVLLGPDELERSGGSPERLVAAVEQAAAGAGLTWPSV